MITPRFFSVFSMQLIATKALTRECQQTSATIAFFLILALVKQSPQLLLPSQLTTAIHHNVHSKNFLDVVQQLMRHPDFPPPSAVVLRR
jgi:hypothetical protein